MKPKIFDIKFDNTQGVFNVGTTVSGTVLLGLDQPIKIKGNLYIFICILKFYIHIQCNLYSDFNVFKFVTDFVKVSNLQIV
jgi:hypothetical protein